MQPFLFFTSIAIEVSVLDRPADDIYLVRMTTVLKLAELGALAGDPARANMLTVLLDGLSHPAKELGGLAGVSPQTASWHLAKLSHAQLLVSERRGRHRYYRLRSPLVAQMLETMLAVASADRARSTGSRLNDALRHARTCYDHLAGRLGVALADALQQRDCLVLSADGGELTPAGIRLLDAFGVDVSAARARKRAFCRPCLDWSERRWHLAGAIGASVATRCFALGWIERTSASRAVQITPMGRDGFVRAFGVALREA
jgi:DNA-binding transcriptional ArsR family regulator